MKKKKIMIIGVIVVLIIAIVGITAVSQSSKNVEKRSFDAVVQEIVTQSDGEVRPIVERTTEIYGDPVNSLGISEDTKLLDADGMKYQLMTLNKSSKVTIKLKDAFIEETPFYYPDVYEIKRIHN